jgi:hypothetical protein
MCTVLSATMTSPSRITQVKQPLSAPEYYLLLALASEGRHKYALIGAIHNLSQHTIDLQNTQINRLIEKFESNSFLAHPKKSTRSHITVAYFCKKKAKDSKNPSKLPAAPEF